MAAVIALGLSAGATLAEGVVLVPYWRSLPPEEFLRWFGDNEQRLVAFFGPLEVVSTALAVAAAGLYVLRGIPGAGRLMAAAVLALAVIAVYPLYFQATNAAFVAGTMALDAVAPELARWSLWHWTRVALGMAAFACALAAVASPTQARRRNAQMA